jgi:hypothetical protein
LSIGQAIALGMQMLIKDDTCWIFTKNSQGIVLKIKVKKEGNLYPMGVGILVERNHGHMHKVPFSEDELTMP